MKKFLKSLTISVILCVFTFNIINHVNASESSFIVLDVDSGRVLYEDNSRAKKRIASLTKIVTCLSMIENFDLSERVVIKPEWTGIEGSSLYLKAGEVLSVEELLFGLMLRSGNDAATAIQGFANMKGQDLITLMNEIAASSGACDSSFKNPHGLDEEGHFSTAYDIAMISRAGMKNEVFKRIVSTQKKTIGQDNNRRVLINKNKLLARYPYANGIKTGYTKKSGRCLASSAEKDGQRLICVVLDYSSTYEMTEKLFDECFNSYRNEVIQTSDEPVMFYEKDGKRLPCYIEQDVIYPLTKEETGQITKRIYSNYQGGFPVKSGTEMGVIEFYLKNQLLFTKKIYNIEM